MSNKIFTEEEIEMLSKNKYVKNVSYKGITYTNEFKCIFITENYKGKLPRQIFEECGFDINVIGMRRVESSGKRWRESYRKNGILGLQDNRKGNSGRIKDKELSLEEKYEQLRDKIEMLESENKLLKKDIKDIIEKNQGRKKQTYPKGINLYI